MRNAWLAALVGSLLTCLNVHAYVEAPHTLGQFCRDATHVVLMEVAKINKEKGLIIYKKVQDLKGKHAQAEIKHNIGKRGFHAREWQNVMNWADVGKQAVFFHNGGASETCIGTYWYQCYPEGEWWGMSHAEPFLLRTYYGDPAKLAAAVALMLQGQEVVVPCLADGNKADLHLRKGKVQRLRASLKRIDYNVKRDFVGFGGDGEDLIEFRTITLLAESSAGWRFLPQPLAATAGNRWREAGFDDASWRTGKAPIGYGEPEIQKRTGTLIQEQGQSFLLRRFLDLPSDLLIQKDVTFRLCVASDDRAVVYLNGQLVDQDPVADHEFSYWSREVELSARQFRPGRNLIAVQVTNRPGSSDLYLDMELSAQIPIKKPAVTKPPLVVAKARPAGAKPAIPTKLPATPRRGAAALAVDRVKRTIAVPCTIAPRKLPTLNEVYPIEVIATYPAPEGQKAHETVVTFADVQPSDVHRALEQLGLKPGRPARGGGAPATGPELILSLEVADAQGKPQRVAFEKVLVDQRTRRPLPALRWYFTGSNMKQPDPEKNDRVYGADLTGTLIALFPVTDDTVIQSSLTMKDEGTLKLEIAKGSLPREGAPARLIIDAK